jgi:hypothetical protein
MAAVTLPRHKTCLNGQSACQRSPHRSAPEPTTATNLSGKGGHGHIGVAHKEIRDNQS